MFIFAQETLPTTIPTQLQGPAWAVGIAIVLWALSGVVKNILDLRYGKGSEAAVKEADAETARTKAQAELKAAEAKMVEADAEEIALAYEKRLKELTQDYKDKFKDYDSATQLQMSDMKANVKLCTDKLEQMSTQHLDCIGKLNLMVGRLQVLEQLQGIAQHDASRQVLETVEQPKLPGSSVAVAATIIPTTGVIKDPDTKEITGKIEMDKPKK